MGQMVEFPSNGHTCSGYLAVPESGRGPALVVIQEYWGIVSHIKDVCDRFAAQGFVALAPDLYHGATATEPDEAGKKMMELRIDTAARDLQGAVGHLVGSEHTTGDGVGVVGFCMGGGLALYLASISPEVRAAVTYYGLASWPQPQPRWEAVQAKVMGHYGDKDGFTPPERIDELERSLRAAGVDVTFHRYPGADHAFFNDTRPEVYDAEAAKQSFDRTLRHLRSVLA